MYNEFFQLHSPPFENRADARFYFARPDFEETVAGIQQEIRHGHGMSLVVGVAGTGKTLLIRALIQRLDASDKTVVLTWPMDGSMDLIRESAKGFGVTLADSPPGSRGLSLLRRHLSGNAERGHRSVLIIDQAENLTSDDIAQLATLASLEADGTKLLRVVLVGQPHVRVLLSQPEFSRISQQLYGERELTSLSCEETEAYIQHRMWIAGAEGDGVFDADAVALIHEKSGGIPRLINQICHAALSAASDSGSSIVSSVQVAEGAEASSYRARSVAAQEVGVATAVQVAAGLPKGSGRGVATLASVSVAEANRMQDRAVESNTTANCNSVETGVRRSPTAPPAAAPFLSRPGRSGDEASHCHESDHPVGLEPHTADGRMLERLEGAIARAERTESRLRDLAAQLADKIDHVQEHLAGRLLEALIQASGVGQTTLDRIQVGIDNAESLMEKADDQQERISAQQAANEEVIAQLGALTTSARQMHDATQSAIAHADEKIGRLGSHQAAATSTARNLASTMGKCENVLNQMQRSQDGLQAVIDGGRDELTALVQKATELSSRIDRDARVIETHCGNATSLIERMESKAAQADQSGTALSGHVEAAQRLIETYDQMKGDADVAMDRLAAQVSATEKSVEAGEPMLKEFIGRSQAIEEHLAEVRQKAHQTEARVSKVMEGPAQLVATAQAEVKKLEQVGRVVRNVFGAVTQATQEAKRESAACHQATKAASERVASLSDHTQRAVGTLREWIQEAVRAQSRLENTLARCPTVQETHPGESLRTAARRIVEGSDHFAEAGAQSAAAASIKPETLARTEVRGAAQQSSRATEISNLIEEAKRVKS